MAEPSTFQETETAALTLIAAAFGDSSAVIAQPDRSDWYAIYEELKKQTMAGVTAEAAKAYRTYIPSELYRTWILYTALIAKSNGRLLAAQEAMLALLQRHGIAAAVIKGSAAACYYPKPLQRNCGDIDFLVNRSDFDRTLCILKENGYVLLYEEDHVDYHITLTKDGISYELHREPAGIAHNPCGDLLRDRFCDVCAKAEPTTLNHTQFMKLPRAENGLILLLHIVKHLDGGLGLRQLCDWMAYVKAELCDTVYRTELAPLLRQYGLSKLEKILTKTCCLYLGLNPDIAPWCMNADTAACTALLHFALCNGNFGKKNASSNRAGAVLGKTAEGSSYPFLFRALCNLQKAGMAQWAAVRRHPWLKGVAWGYLPFRYVGRLLCRERSIKDTEQLLRTIKSDKNLKDAMAVFQPE